MSALFLELPLPLQVFGILGAMMFVRMGLEPIVKGLRGVFNASVPWERSSEFHILREVSEHGWTGLRTHSSDSMYEPATLPAGGQHNATCCPSGADVAPWPLQVYRPMETLFIIAAFTTLAENFLPQLIAIPRVKHGSHAPLSAASLT